MRVIEHFRRNVRAYLRRTGYTVADIARQSGVNKAQAGRAISGETKNPSINTLEDIAKGTGFDLRTLLLPPSEFMPLLPQPQKKSGKK